MRRQIELTKREAHLVYCLLDGCVDAGSCDDGLTKEENDAAWKVMEFLRRFDEASK